MVSVVLLIVEGCVEKVEVIKSRSQGIRRYHMLIREHYETNEKYEEALDNSAAEPLIQIIENVEVQ